MEVAASVIAVTQLCEKVIRYANNVSGAKDDRGRLRDQVRGCSMILLQLQDKIEDTDDGQTWSETLTCLATPLTRLYKALDMAATKLQGTDNSREKLTWPFKEKEVQKLIAAIESEKGLLGLALQNNSARLLHDINTKSKDHNARLSDLTDLLQTHSQNNKDDYKDLKGATSTIQSSQSSMLGEIRAVLDQQKNQQQSEDRRKTLDWLKRLSLIDHISQQHDIICRRQVGTGLWFLHSDKYEQWLNARGDVLFCPGIPGAGKTILTSIVVADLSERYFHDNSVATVFVYCDFRRHAEHTLFNIMSSALLQIAQRQAVLSASIQSFYNNFVERGTRPSFEEVREAFEAEVSSYAKVFFVIDALDEYQMHIDLLTQVLRLQRQCKLNLLATSRYIPDIVALLDQARIIEINASREDVQTYVQAYMHRLPRFVSSSPTLQIEIMNSIVQSVDGM